MIRNYLTIAFRFLLKNKTFSLINIVGLSVGTLCCVYIVLYVIEQYSYDKHHREVDTIFRINSSLDLPGDKHENMATASPPIAPAMKNDFGEVQQFTRVVATIGISQHLLQYGDKSFYEKEAVFVDSTFFDVFNYHFVEGNPAKSLTEPYSVVLLKPTADKLFGESSPINKVIQIDNGYGKNDFKVTAVVDETMGKSHIHANMFITMRSGGLGDFVLSNNAWAGNNFTASYIKLHPKANALTLEKKLPAFVNKYGQEQLEGVGMKKVLRLQPVSSIHTTTAYNGEPYKAEMGKPVNPKFLNILVLIAALIQLIACINFMNLSTARASKRAKEVGVRKVVGAEKTDLIKQFLGESFLLSILAILLTVPLLWLALPYLNQITNANITLSVFTNFRIWVLLALIALVTGLIAGSYPAFYLSAFQAIKVIKGNFANHISAAGIRRSLVVFQFVLSIALIISIIIIYSQINFIKNKDLGFKPEQTLVFTFHTNDSRSKIRPFMNDLQQLPEVKAASRANNFLSQMVFNDFGVFLEGGNQSTARNAPFMVSDQHFLKANGIKLISGRDFRLHDSARVLINETLANQLGINPKNAPGTKLHSQPGDVFEIAGVMKDFNYNSLHEAVKPFLLIYGRPEADEATAANLNNVIVATDTKDYKTLLGKISTAWHKHLPGVPFEYSFLDEAVQKQYETEITLARIINSFTTIAILISCLGLFGLAAFSAEQRRKEISIRKVLGANVSMIIQLLSKDFLRLVFIAILISTPIAWWAMNKWLQAFVYRIDVSWWMFALAGAIAIFIALCTVSFHAIKAAFSNPVRSLRTE